MRFWKWTRKTVRRISIGRGGGEKDASERGRMKEPVAKERKAEQRRRKERERRIKSERWPKRGERKPGRVANESDNSVCRAQTARGMQSRLPAFINLFPPPSASLVLSPDNMPSREREGERGQFEAHGGPRAVFAEFQNRRLNSLNGVRLRHAREIDFFPIGGIRARNYCRHVRSRFRSLSRADRSLLMPAAVTYWYLSQPAEVHSIYGRTTVTNLSVFLRIFVAVRSCGLHVALRIRKAQ